MSNYKPPYVSFMASKNLSDIVPSTQIAQDIGNKIDAASGQATGLYISLDSSLGPISVQAIVDFYNGSSRGQNTYFQYDPASPAPIVADTNPLVSIGVTLSDLSGDYLAEQNARLYALRNFMNGLRSAAKKQAVARQKQILAGG